MVVFRGFGPGGAGPPSGEALAGNVRQMVQEGVLQLLVVDRGVRLVPALMEPVAATRAGLRVIAGGEPFLGQVAEPQVVGSALARPSSWAPSRDRRRC